MPQTPANSFCEALFYNSLSCSNEKVWSTYLLYLFARIRKYKALKAVIIEAAKSRDASPQKKKYIRANAK
jgi:hypothetical protein